MRPPVLVLACLAVPCLLLAQLVSSVPVYDENDLIQAISDGDWPVDALGDAQYFLAADKRARSNRRELGRCMDWIHNRWRPCLVRKQG